jgi:cysteine sulfinate desulfinase/cysteine desulfurase-like protein
MHLSDYAKATTPVDPRVLDAMLPYLTDQYGNPHSRTHAYGWEAEKGVEDARKVRISQPILLVLCSHAIY